MSIDLGKYGVLDASKIDEGTSPQSVPDPSPLPKVGGDWLLVRPVDSVPEKTAGGIYLPEDTQGDMKYLNNVGRVLAAGPRAYKLKDGSALDWVEGGVNTGDIVQWERFVGKRMRFKGVNLVLIKDVAVQMVLENATDVDSTVSIEA